MFETAWENKGLSYFAREYSFKTSSVDLSPRIMVSMATQHPGMDQKCLTKKWSASCKAAEQVTLLAGSQMRATNWAAVDLMFSSSSCNKHMAELSTLGTQVKAKIHRLVGKLIANNMSTNELKWAWRVLCSLPHFTPDLILIRNRMCEKWLVIMLSKWITYTLNNHSVSGRTFSPAHKQSIQRGIQLFVPDGSLYKTRLITFLCRDIPQYCDAKIL